MYSKAEIMVDPRGDIHMSSDCAAIGRDLF